MQTWTRRNMLRLAVALPAAGLFARLRALAGPNLSKVKITNVQAMAIKNIAGNCLIRGVLLIAHMLLPAITPLSGRTAVLRLQPEPAG